MISVLALLAIQAAEPVAATPEAVPEAVEAEITVIAKKLETWRGTAKSRDGSYYCEIKKSSGDAEIDAIRCNAMRWCLSEMDKEIQPLAESGLSRKELKAKMKQLSSEKMPVCLENYEEASIERLAWERVG